MRWRLLFSSLFVIAQVLSVLPATAQTLQLGSSETVNNHYSEYLVALERGLRERGYSFEHTIYPGMRLNQVSNHHQLHLVSLMPRSGINTDFLRPVLPEVTQGYIYIYYHKDVDISSLVGKTAAIGNGTLYQQPIVESYQMNQIKVASSDVAMRMVNSGRADMTFQSNSAKLTIHNEELTNVRFTTVPIAVESFHLVVHRDVEHLIPMLSAMISQLKDEGAFNYRSLDGTLAEDVPYD